MAQPHIETSPSPPNSGTLLSFGQSLLPSLSKTPHPLFNQKLIPRDFLGIRPKQSHNTKPDSGSNSSQDHFIGNPFHSNNSGTYPTSENQDRQTDLHNDTANPTEGIRAHHSISRDNDLDIPEKRFPEIPTSLRSTLRARRFPSESSASCDSQPTPRTTMPRTSSIDSAISSISTTSLNKVTSDVREASPTSVRDLIATAGGAENLVLHLLKDKNSIASQNAQLWKLVEKQRALILGLNKDLDRLTKERDRYKRRVKEMEIHSLHQNIDIRGGASPVPEKIPVSVVKAVQPTQEPNSSDSILAVEAVNTTTPLQLPAEQSIVAPESTVLDDQNAAEIPVSKVSDSVLPELNIGNPKSSALSLQEPALETRDVVSPAVTMVEAPPSAEKSSKHILSNRKAPPKPLNLTPSAEGFNKNLLSTGPEVEEESERGRRRTREEDDRDREISAKKAEAEARSRSKKNKALPASSTEDSSVPVQTLLSAPLPVPGLPLSPRPQHAQTFVAPAAAQLAIVNAVQPASLGEQLYALPLKSPGLPMSPRPNMKAEAITLTTSLPLSPRANMGSFPLTPRAPKHALPAPTSLSAPTGTAVLQATQSRSHQPSPLSGTTPPADRLQVHSPVGSEPPQVYRGLAVSAYPNLLLPPNALPSIQVKVHSSRLRPSRFGVLNIKSGEDTTVFSLSIISRSSNSELWRIEKIPSALPQLEQQLRPRCAELPKMPDRKLFAGQSPTMLDERRIAIDHYFDELLDIHIDEQAAVAICRFLSTDVIDPDQATRSASSTGSEMGMPSVSPGGQTMKTGYLTKKGKNFGGWKTRFFILDGAEFRYYESAGGPHLGTIRLHNALIGRQKESDSVDDGDSQYRHAFLIQEPKRKDSASYTRHVLCAESDTERDDWVKALLHWVEGGVTSRNGSVASTGYEINDTDSRNLSSRVGLSNKEPKDTHINTPTPTSGSSIDSSILDHTGPTRSVNISGPINGNVITDSSMWGSKTMVVPAAPAVRETREKTHKMSNIFGFKRPEPAAIQQEQKPSKPRILRHNGYVRPVFGIPLAEAVEFCAPFNVDVDLPAVVYRTIEYLRHKNAAFEEGIFRLSGSNVVVRNLKERFNVEGDVDLVHENEYHDVHAVASLFKSYLRELPSTLLTRDLHIEFIKVLELESSVDKVAAYNGLVHMLPPANFSLLKAMSKYLLEVTQCADKNKMSARNIGIVFSPTLNIPTPVFTMFLTEYEGIFERGSAQPSDIKTTEIKAPQPLTPDDVRSPRHQMFTDLPSPGHQQTTFHSQTTMVPPRGTMTGTGELGFMAVNPVYDSNELVSIHPTNALTQIPDIGSFGSLNGLLSPPNPPNDRARKRQSVIIT